MWTLLWLLMVLPSSTLSTNHDSPRGRFAFRYADSNNLTGRIVNGMEASLAQFPHQVSLRYSRSDRHFCGGSIISIKVVVTAAHCMYRDNIMTQKKKPSMIKVVAGVLKLDKPASNDQMRGVKKFEVHPQFNSRTLQNDIAILELAKPFKFTPMIHDISLPTSDFVPDIVCKVSGWGRTVQDTRVSISNDLMYVYVPIRKIKECRELLVNITDMPAGMFCAGYLEGGRDACQGDSGGGMICNGVLTGVVSSGIGCALPLLPGLYTNVFHYRDWILNGKFVKPADNVHDQQPHDDFFKNMIWPLAILTITVVILSCFLSCLRHLQLQNKGRKYVQDKYVE